MTDSPAIEPTEAVHVGRSALLRIAPWMLLLVALAQLASARLILAGLLAAVAVLLASVLPWRFVVFDEGVLLSFAIRGERFFSKQDVSVRPDGTGAVLLPTRTAHRGYALTDGIFRSSRSQLRDLFASHGFCIV